MAGPVEAGDFAKTGTLVLETPLNFLLTFNLHKMRRHDLPPRPRLVNA
jgi:hypothetical protein